MGQEEIQTVPFAIMFNKIDAPNSVGEGQLRQIFGMQHTTGLTTKKIDMQPNSRPIEVFMCSITRKQGYREVFEWISLYL